MKTLSLHRAKAWLLVLNNRITLHLAVSLLFCCTAFSQKTNTDSIELDYSKIYSFALDADISAALKFITPEGSKLFSARARKFRNRFMDRFGEESDKSDYLQSRRSGLDDILIMYVDYWRASLLHPHKNFDSTFKEKITAIMADRFGISLTVASDSLNAYLKRTVENNGYYTTGFGKTGKLFDLLVWKKQRDTVYTFQLKDEKIRAPVVLMDSFLTLGWEEYATFGVYYPGGWATKESLYAVQTAYNLQSERFLVGYLAHEGTHFSDYKKFPKLSGIDLEYRAKLLELSLAKDDLYKTIDFFIQNSNANSSNPHSAANYFVIRDLSKRLFGKDFETNPENWKSTSIKKIHKQAFKLYKKNSNALRKKGSDTVTRFIN